MEPTKDDINFAINLVKRMRRAHGKQLTLNAVMLEVNLPNLKAARKWAEKHGIECKNGGYSVSLVAAAITLERRIRAERIKQLRTLIT